MRSVHILSMLLLAAIVRPGSGADKNAPKPARELPALKELPNPFTFADGSPVRNKDDWDRRRRELKELFQDYVYGHLPPKPEKMTIKRGEKITDEENKLIVQDLELRLEQKDKSLTMPLRIVLPQNIKGPMPVVIQSGFGRRGAASGKRFTSYTKRDYAVAECYFQEAAADNKNRPRDSGVYQLFGDKIDCGALMAWAWGVQRVMDALETVDAGIQERKGRVPLGHSQMNPCLPRPAVLT